MNEEKKLVKCSIGGCGREVEREKALVPPLKVLAEHLKRRVRLEDLEANAVCSQCARAFVSAAQEEARLAGRSIGQIFHLLKSSEAEVTKRQQAWEEKKRAEAEAERQRVLSSPLGAMFGSTFARLKEEIREREEQAQVVEHPTAKKTRKKDASAPRSKKAAG